MTQKDTKDKFDEFLDEVENDIRQEHYIKLWQTYGKYVSGFVTTGLVVLTAYFLWSQSQDKQQLRNADYFMTAQRYIDEGKFPQALSVLKEIQPGSFWSASKIKTYPHLARFTQAALLQEPGEQQNIDQAIATYEALGQDSTVDSIWRNMATLQSIRLQFQKDPTKASELLKRIDPLTKEGTPFYALALEQKAMMLHQGGQNAEAAEIFAKLVQMRDAPDGLVMRAQVMVQQLGKTAK